MIPKIIHYCWFGGKKKPGKLEAYLSGWHKKCKEYQIVEWNETNFDINANQYVKEAYDQGKFAFVSDVARIVALKEYGGIYLDTDVEIIKSWDEEWLNEFDGILGFEEKDYIAKSFMAFSKDHPILNAFLKSYENDRFCMNRDKDIITNVRRLTSLLERYGLKRNNEKQILNHAVAVFPKEYFSPYDYINCVYEMTENTCCVHHFFVSWMPLSEKIKKYSKKCVASLFGKQKLEKLREIHGNKSKHHRSGL